MDGMNALFSIFLALVCRVFYYPAPAVHERGKVIGVGVHIYIYVYMFVDQKKFFFIVL